MLLRKVFMTLLLFFTLAGIWGTADAHAYTTSTSLPVSQHNTASPEIALTFDDGPNPPYTSQIVSILHQYGVPATFFVTGTQALVYPQLVQQEAAARNVIGDHTWNHPQLTTLPADQIRWQLDSTAQVIQQETGHRPALMRPPYGSLNAIVRGQITQDGYTPILWNIDTLDWQRPGSAVIAQRVLSQASNGSIVLMHDGGGDRSQTVAALPAIITTLMQRGFHFVTV